MMGFLRSFNPYALAAGAAGWVFAALFLWQMIEAKGEIKAQIEKCNTDKVTAIAEAERIVREAERRAAGERLEALQAELNRELIATNNERQRRIQAERRADERELELKKLAREAFDEDEIPDSDACLNAFVSSRALRCVLHARDNREAGGGPGPGDDALCADPGGPDGVHSGFSNVTFLDALMYWGGDRDAAIRWNERAVKIRQIQDEVIHDGNGD